MSPQTESQRKAKNKWDSANMTNLCLKIRKDYAEAIKAKCKAHNTTPSAIMRKAIDDFMESTQA